MLSLSPMAAAVQPSATLAAGAKARQLQARGIRVYDFSLGEPDFPTPEHICRAATQAMREGRTHYTPAAGMPELRAAVAQSYQKTNGLKCGPENVVISNGAKHSIHNTLAALCGPGDEVVIPSPYWVSYSDLVQMVGARAVLVPTTAASGFKVSPAQLRAALTSRTRLVLINSPCNPTGTVYERSELEALADVILDSRAGVLSDEIYERLVYGRARPTCFATLRPELSERTVTVSGVSKSYAMTGWRIGWAIGPVSVTNAMANVQSQETSSPSSVSQCAALAALQGDQACVGEMRAEFEARRELVCDRLAALPEITCRKPDGAFYAFPDVSAYFGRNLGGEPVRDSAEFCRAVLERAHVNLVPGSAFGAEGYARLSFAAAREEIVDGLDQLARLLATV